MLINVFFYDKELLLIGYFANLLLDSSLHFVSLRMTGNCVFEQEVVGGKCRQPPPAPFIIL